MEGRRKKEKKEKKNHIYLTFRKQKHGFPGMKFYLIINPGMFVLHSSERTPKTIDPISTCFPLSDASPIPKGILHT
jgi:hypothetical protein